MTAAKRDAEPKTRTMRVPAGIVGAKVEEIEREVPADEPPPLGLNSDLSVVGKRTPRLDGRLKVTGAAKYTADVRLPGMLFARMVTSPHPHARVLSIDTSAAAAHPQVRAVHILERVLDVAELRDKSKELPSKYPVVRFAGEFRTQVQTHSALETHGVVADWKPEGLTVYASTQGTASVRDELADIFNLKKSQVRVITEFMGGGFGAKFGAGNFGVLATHLSKKAGAPVRLMLDRKDEHLSVGNRPDSVQRLRIGAKRDGTLTAIQLEAYGTAGTGTGAGCAGPAQNMYACGAIVTEESDVFTHAGPAAAFRAPGHPQGCFALEQLIDELAEKLNLDPLALRDKIDKSDARREERRIGAERVGWSKRHAPGADAGAVKRGLGVAQAVWYRFVDMDSSVEVRITRD